MKKFRVLVFMFVILISVSVYSDDTEKSKDVVIDSFSTTDGWGTYKDNGTTIEVKGSDKALEIDYKMVSGKWVGTFKAYSNDFKDVSGFKFKYRGEGSANTVEFKLEDPDGSNFGTVLSTKSNKIGRAHV